jgi:hypothetical protein
VRWGVKKIQAVADTLDPANGPVEERRREFEKLQEQFSKQKTPLARS